MTPKPTRAGTDLLVALLAAETNGDASIPADDLSAKVIEGLFNRGLIRKRIELSDAGRRAAHAAIHPDEGTA